MTGIKTKIRTLAQFLKIVKELPSATEQFWFRGQPSGFKNSLRPLLYRRNYRDAKDALYAEDCLRSEFMRLGIQVAGGQPRDYWDWYFVMQHFGAPTRLLDWTDNALVALHFALSSEASAIRQMPEEENPVVYILDPYWLNHQAFRRSFRGMIPSGVVQPDWPAAEAWLLKDLFRSPITKKYPVAINPPHISQRLAVQGSRFVLFGRDFDGLVHLCRLARMPGLSHLEIEASAIPDIRIQLRACGMSHFTLFPDLGGLGKQLLADWSRGKFD
jgi:hypothetical protein